MKRVNLVNSVIVIPTLNPDQKLVKLAKELKKAKLNKILIINDGSNNNSYKLFEELKGLGCIVFEHPINLGKGEALKTGFEKADNYFKNISGFITADSDGQHQVKDILKVAMALEKAKDQIILGVRDFNEPNIPLKSKWGNKISSLFFTLKTGIKCRDTQTGLRGVPYSLKDFSLKVLGSRYEYEMNYLIKAAVQGYTFIYIPIETIYENNNDGTHFRPIKDSWRIYKDHLFDIIYYLIEMLLFYLCYEAQFLNSWFLILGVSFLLRMANKLLNFNNYQKPLSKVISSILSSIFLMFIFWGDGNLILLKIIGDFIINILTKIKRFIKKEKE